MTGEHCHHCDIGAGEGAAFDLATNRRRDWLGFASTIERISLRSATSSSTIRARFSTRGRCRPDLLDEILSDSPIASSRSRCLARLARGVHQASDPQAHHFGFWASGLTVRPILGIESADDRIRNEILRKAMPRTAIMRVFRDVSTVAAEYGADRIGLDVNIVIAGPGTTSETAVDDAARTAEFALSAGAKSGVAVDLNLHPYYVGSRGSSQFPDHRRCRSRLRRSAASKIAQSFDRWGSSQASSSAGKTRLMTLNKKSVRTN